MLPGLCPAGTDALRSGSSTVFLERALFNEGKERSCTLRGFILYKHWPVNLMMSLMLNPWIVAVSHVSSSAQVQHG